MSDEDPAESDRVPGAPHPRHASSIIGHSAAAASFQNAARAKALHHAWLISGPRGVGKATLAWALARWLLADCPENLSDATHHPVNRRIAALSEPRFCLIRRPVDEKTGRLRAEITVDEIRRLLTFFRLTAADGGRRVAIIDCADEMNGSAANALLKMLEEPPKDAILFLISHQPGRLLPTIRSRCRELRLAPLSSDEIADVLNRLDITESAERLTALSGGSVGEALRLAGQNGLSIYQRIVDLFARPGRMDRRAASALADMAGARAGAGGDPFDLVMTLLDRFLSRAALTGLLGAPLAQAADNEGATLSRIAPDSRAAQHWAAAQAELSARARAGRAVNLDPSALVLDMLIGLSHLPESH